jgi:hypothetical protein
MFGLPALWQWGGDVCRLDTAIISDELLLQDVRYPDYQAICRSVVLLLQPMLDLPKALRNLRAKLSARLVKLTGQTHDLTRWQLLDAYL